MIAAPQARHKPRQAKSENGGFLRVSEEWHIVAENLKSYSL